MSVNPAVLPSATPEPEELAFDELFDEFYDALAVPDDTAPLPAKRFEIDDDSKANWALGKYRQLVNAQAKDEQFYAHEKRRLDTWLAQSKKRHGHFREYLESLLLRYYKQLKARDPKLKTVQLPNGTFIEKTLGGKGFEVIDKEQLLDWARTNASEFIKVEESVDWVSLKKLLAARGERIIFEETGEVVPGVAQALPDTKFYVTPSKD